MATATITPDQNTVIAEVFIAAPPARVFQAISDPQQMPQWWGQSGLYTLTKSTMDVRPGGKWRSGGAVVMRKLLTLTSGRIDLGEITSGCAVNQDPCISNRLN